MNQQCCRFRFWTFNYLNIAYLCVYHELWLSLDHPRRFLRMFFSLNRNGWRADFHLHRLVTLVVNLANVNCYICQDNRLYFDDTDVSYCLRWHCRQARGDAFVFHSVDGRCRKKISPISPIAASCTNPVWVDLVRKAFIVLIVLHTSRQHFVAELCRLHLNRSRVSSLWFNRLVWLYSKWQCRCRPTSRSQHVLQL